MFKHFNPLGSGKVKSSVPLAFCKSRLNLGGLSAETAIIEALCHNSCGTKWSLLCPKVIGVYILLPYNSPYERNILEWIESDTVAENSFS